LGEYVIAEEPQQAVVEEPPEPTFEQQLGKVKNLADLRPLAKANTRSITDLRHTYQQVALDIKELQDRDGDEEQIKQLTGELDRVHQEFEDKRQKSSILLRKRDEYKQEQEKQESAARSQADEDLERDIQLPAVKKMKVEIQNMLQGLAENADKTASRVRGSQYYMVKRKLRALARAAMTAHQALKRCPEITVEDEEE